MKWESVWEQLKYQMSESLLEQFLLNQITNADLMSLNTPL